MNKWMDLEKATAQSAIFFLFFFFWKNHICALCIVYPGVFFNLCFPVSETQRQKALSPSSVLTGPFHTLAAPQSLPGDRWQRHKDNTGGCRPPGGDMLSHTKISWSHGREVKNRATGEGGIMKRWRDNKEMGEDSKRIREWGEHIKENKSIQLTMIPEAFLWNPVLMIKWWMCVFK